MHGIYSNIPDTNHVSRVHGVAAVLYSQFMLHVMLFRMLNMLCTVILALPTVCVQCTIWLFFYSSLISCPPGMLLRYCLNYTEMVPAAPVITGITSAFTFHMGWISVMLSIYVITFSASFSVTFLSPVIATSVNMHVPCLLSRIMMSGLLLGIVLSVRTVGSTIR